MSYRGHKLVHHGGNLHGFCSDVYLAPDSGHAVVVLANAHASGIRTALPLAIFDQLLGLEPEPWGERLFELMGAIKGGMREASAHRATKAAGRPPSRPLAGVRRPILRIRRTTSSSSASTDEQAGAGLARADGMKLRHRDSTAGTCCSAATTRTARCRSCSAAEPTASPVSRSRSSPRSTRSCSPASRPASAAQLDAAGRGLRHGPLTLLSVGPDGLLAEVAGGKPTALNARDDTHFDVPGSSGTRLEFVLGADGAVETVVVEPAGVFRPAGKTRHDTT